MSFNDPALTDTLASDNTKNSADFGLKTIKGAYLQWKNGWGSESWLVRKTRFDYNRAFANARQPSSEYENIIDTEGQLAVINLDYSPNPIAVPFLNRMKDKFMQRVEKISCTSIDPFTQDKKKTAKENALFKLKNKEKIMAVQQQAGIPLEEFSDNDPEDEQELDIEFGFNYKEREEVVMENLINLVFYDNKWSRVIKDRMFDDLICCGYAISKTYIDANGRIKIKFVKPENFITSYSEWNDLRDWEWQGEVDYMTITDIRLKYPGKVTEEKLFDLARDHAGQYGNNAWTFNWSYIWLNALARPYDSYRVPVCNLTYKTLYNLTYEKNTDRFGKEILDKVKTEKEGKEYEKSDPYYVSYTGAWIVDTEYLLEWGLSKNMIKPEENLTEILSPYTIYMYNNNQMVNTPMVETMQPSIKMMQLLNLQTQNIIATIAPDGADIDVATLSDIDLGNGIGVVSPLQLYSIYLQTGNRYYKSIDDGGEQRREPPIRPNVTNFSNKLEQLDAQWWKEYEKLIIIVGSNNLDAGRISNQAVGKGVYQDAVKQGESASNYLYNAFINIMEPTAKKVQQLGWDILVYKKGGYAGYMAALGSDKVEYIVVEGTEDFERAQFDTKIEAVIDDTAQALLQERINIALNNQAIELQDALQVEELSQTNLTYASYLLASRMKKRRKEMMQEKQMDIQMNNQAAQISAQAKSDGDMKLEQLKADLASQAKKEELQMLEASEIIKFNSIAKVEIIKSTMAKEGGSLDQVPAWVFAGMPEIQAVQQQLMAEQSQDLSQEQIEEQQAQEAQMAQQQQMPMGQDQAQMQPEMAEQPMQ